MSSEIQVFEGSGPASRKADRIKNELEVNDLAHAYLPRTRHREAIPITTWLGSENPPVTQPINSATRLSFLEVLKNPIFRNPIFLAGIAGELFFLVHASDFPKDSPEHYINVLAGALSPIIGTYGSAFYYNLRLRLNSGKSEKI